MKRLWGAAVSRVAPLLPNPIRILMSDKRWIYLNDMHGQAKIFNPATQAVKTIMASQVQAQAPIGLRRYELEEVDGGSKYRELGTCVPMTEDLFDECVEAYEPGRNGWMYDWPHWQSESEATQAMHDELKLRLEKSMALHPYEFEIIGLQRRRLMYYSDGNYSSQQKFLAMLPHPNGFPYRPSGALKRRYRGTWGSTERDAKVPFPKAYEQEVGGGLKPCLYNGAAWVVRVKLDGQVLPGGHVNMYVRDDGHFIGTDLCQRHDRTSYDKGGINLQEGIYTFDGWVTNPGIAHATKNGWKPKSGKIVRESVKDLLRKSPPPVVVPTLAQALETAQQIMVKQAKPAVLTLPDVLAERVRHVFTVNEGTALKPEQVVDLEVERAQQAFASKVAKDLDGVPLFVPKASAEAQAGVQVIATAIQTDPLVASTGLFNVLRLRAWGYAKSPLAAGYPTMVSLQMPGKANCYVDLKLINAIDADGYRAELLPLAKQEWAKRNAKEAGPITADAIKEAEQLMSGYKATVAATRHAAFLAEAVKNGVLDASKLPVQGVVESTESVLVEVVGAKTVEFLPLADEAVRIYFGTGKPYFVAKDATSPTGFVCSQSGPVAEGKDVLPVNPVTPLEEAAKVYYERVAKTPEAYTAAGGSNLGNSLRTAEFRSGMSLWRAVPRPDGNVWLRQLAVGPGESAVAGDHIVTRKANGHPYLVVNGETTTLENETLRAAALAYYKEVVPEQDVLTTLAAVANDGPRELLEV